MDLFGGLPHRESNPPMVLEKGTLVSSNSLILFSENVSCFEEKVPCFGEKVPCFEEKVPCFGEKVPCFEEKVPCFDEKFLVLRKISDTTNSRFFNGEISIIHHPRACAYTRTIQEFSYFCCHKCHILIRNDLKSIGYVCG